MQRPMMGVSLSKGYDYCTFCTPELKKNLSCIHSFSIPCTLCVHSANHKIILIMIIPLEQDCNGHTQKNFAGGGFCSQLSCELQSPGENLAGYEVSLLSSDHFIEAAQLFSCSKVCHLLDIVRSSRIMGFGLFLFS